MRISPPQGGTVAGHFVAGNVGTLYVAETKSADI